MWSFISLFLLTVIYDFSYSSVYFPYEVVRYEASDYRTFTRSMMKTLLGDHQIYLASYLCDGKKEFDPLWAPVRMNPQVNSLMIKNDQTGEIYFYRKGKLFDNKRLRMKSPQSEFVRLVYENLSKLEEFSESQKLLRHLEESYFPITIVKGQNSFNPKPPNARSRWGIQMSRAISIYLTGRMSPVIPYYDIGVGGELNWNPLLKINSLEEDGVLRTSPSDVVLAHELYHAFDSIRGLLDNGLIKSDMMEFAQIQEFRGVYFENLIRKRKGLKMRKSYSMKVDEANPHRDMLDDAGLPLMIPATCLEMVDLHKYL